MIHAPCLGTRARAPARAACNASPCLPALAVHPSCCDRGPRHASRTTAHTCPCTCSCGMQRQTVLACLQRFQRISASAGHPWPPLPRQHLPSSTHCNCIRSGRALCLTVCLCLLRQPTGPGGAHWGAGQRGGVLRGADGGNGGCSGYEAPKGPTRASSVRGTGRLALGGMNIQVVYSAGRMATTVGLRSSSYSAPKGPTWPSGVEGAGRAGRGREEGVVHGRVQVGMCDVPWRGSGLRGQCASWEGLKEKGSRGLWSPISLHAHYAAPGAAPAPCTQHRT